MVMDADKGGGNQGGGQALAFPMRPTPPPSKETIDMLSGVIAGGPLIRLSNPAPGYQVGVWNDSSVEKIGLADM